MVQLYCKFKGHDLKPLVTGTDSIQEFECANCQQHFTMYGEGKLVKLTKYWKKNNQYVALHFSNASNKAS